MHQRIMVALLCVSSAAAQPCDPTKWHSLDTGPGGRIAGSMAHDPDTGAILMFGGDASSALGDTWTFDPRTLVWTARTPLHSPSPRDSAAIAYDPTRRRFVLFGGYYSFALPDMNDTWEWDVAAGNWFHRPVASPPPKRQGASMGFDPARGRIIMFGGARGGSFPLNDTWEWHSESNEWIQLQPAHIPPVTSFSPMAYDPVGERLIVHTTGEPSSATWAWNSAAGDWEQLKTEGAPPFRYTHAMVTDWGRGTVVLYAGYPSSLNDTWEFDGSSNTWTQRASGPASRIYAMMAYDPATARSYLFGGFAGSYLGELWSWDGNAGAWQFLAPAHRPGLNQAVQMTFDHNRARAVLMGGSQDSGLFEWDGLGWSRHFPAVEPPRRTRYALIFDGTRTLLIGGRAMGQDLNDTWAWDGTSWTQLNSANLTPRSNPKVSWDSQRNRVVLFGGSRQVTELTDTWEWDGTAWELAATAGPTERVQYTAMAFDPLRAQTIAFIGGSGTQATQTWTWNGVEWTQLQPAHHPSARSGHAMAWDDSLGAIVLTGGYGPPAFSDTWLWNGTDWQAIDTGPGVGRFGHLLVFDSRRRQLLQYGGSSGSASEATALSDTLALGCRCRADCDSSGLPPALNVNDFICFLNRYAAGKHDANCDQSTTPPVLDVNDFLCFSSLFAAGCP